MNPDAPVPATGLFGGSSGAVDSPSLQNSIAPFPLPVVTVPDHELIRLIGGGSYGQVWLAKNALGTLRAVKVVHRQSFEREDSFEREFKGLQRFEPISRSHDGFVDILHLGRNDAEGYFYYVMELADAAPEALRVDGSSLMVDGGDKGSRFVPSTTSPSINSQPSAINSYTPHTLRHDLRTRGCPPLKDCLSIGLKLTAALEHLHAQGLVHRDIKPSNIIFVNGEPKLADIGLVANIDDARSMVGTMGYIPLEGPGKPQADIYSLGKVFYEIALGKDRQDFPQLPPDLQSHPDYAALLELNEIILRACESDPRRRYQSAQEMQADLTLLQRGESVKQKRTRKRHWAIAKRLGLACAPVGLLITALVVFKGSKLEHKPNPEALRQYELGRWFYNQLTPEAHKKAMEHLSRAAETDANFVLPYRELTALYVWGQAGLFASQEERIRNLKIIADKLLAMDPRLAEGHAALSWWHFLNQDLPGAEDEIVRAIKLNPDYPIARDIYVFYLSMLDRADEAQRQVQRSQELDPTARTSAMVAAWPFFAARQFDKAIAQLQRVVELDKNFPEAHNLLGRCYEAQSNYVAAIEEWKTYDLMVGHDPARVTASYDALRQAYDTGGEQGYLRKYIDLIRENESLPEAEQIFFVQDIAGYYAQLGEKEKALDELEKQLDDPKVRMQLKFEPMHDTLYDEPRFKALLKKAGLEK